MRPVTSPTWSRQDRPIGIARHHDISLSTNASLRMGQDGNRDRRDTPRVATAHGAHGARETAVSYRIAEGGARPWSGLRKRVGADSAGAASARPMTGSTAKDNPESSTCTA